MRKCRSSPIKHMSRLSSRATRFWRISIPISSRDFCANTKFIRNAFRTFPYPRGGCAERCPPQLSKLLFPKSRRSRHFDLVLSGDLFHYRQPRPRGGRGHELALSALAGNSHPHSHFAFAEGKTAPAEKPAFLGHFPHAQ